MIRLEITGEYFWLAIFDLDVSAKTSTVLAIAGVVIAWKVWKQYK